MPRDNWEEKLLHHHSCNEAKLQAVDAAVHRGGTGQLNAWDTKQRGLTHRAMSNSGSASSTAPCALFSSSPLALAHVKSAADMVSEGEKGGGNPLFQMRHAQSIVHTLDTPSLLLFCVACLPWALIPLTEKCAALCNCHERQPQLRERSYSQQKSFAGQVGL